MKIIICTRDLSFGGVGSYVQGLLRELDKNSQVDKVLVIAPEKMEGLSKKIEFNILRNFGKYFITKEPHFAYHCAKKLEILIPNIKLRLDVGIKARKRVEKKYSIGKIADKYIKEYNSLKT